MFQFRPVVDNLDFIVSFVGQEGTRARLRGHLSSLHASGVEQGILEVTRGNGVSDEQASAFKLVIYIEMFGITWDDVKRRVVNLYEVHKVENGLPVGHPQYVWHANGDRFEKITDPHQFGHDAEGLARRAEIISGLAGTQLHIFALHADQGMAGVVEVSGSSVRRHQPATAVSLGH
jgi:hypothetical protein